MVKKPKKPLKTEKNISNTLLEYNFPQPKSRQKINREYYQKNKEERQKQRREKYQQQKLQTQQQEKEQSSKYYGAEAFKILMSLKEYTELNSEKRKIWLDFIWTFRELADSMEVKI